MSKALVLGAAISALCTASASAQVVYPGYGYAPYGYGYAGGPLYDYAAPSYGYGYAAPSYGYGYGYAAPAYVAPAPVYTAPPVYAAPAPTPGYYAAASTPLYDYAPGYWGGYGYGYGWR